MNNSKNTLFYIFTSFLLLMIVVVNYYFSGPLNEIGYFNKIKDSVHFADDLFVHNSALSSGYRISNGCQTTSIGFPTYKFKSTVEFSSKQSASEDTHSQTDADIKNSPNANDYNYQVVKSTLSDNDSHLHSTVVNFTGSSELVYIKENSSRVETQRNGFIGFHGVSLDMNNNAATADVLLRTNTFDANNSLAVNTDLNLSNGSMRVSGDPGDPGDNGIPVGDGYYFLFACIFGYIIVLKFKK